MLVQLTGDVDISVREELRLRLDAAATQSNEVDIDLAAVDYADSTALSIFISLRNKLRARGGRVRLLSPRPAVLKILRYAGLDQAFEIVGAA